MPFIQVRDIPVNYHIYHSDPSAETIVLIHGLGLDQEIWEPILPYVREHYRVVLLDMRGHGRTGRGETPVSWELFTGDLHMLLTQLELGPVHLLGHGFGASLAVKFSLQYAELVKSLILLSTPAFLPRKTVESIVHSRKQLTSNGTMLTLAESLVNGLFKLPGDSVLYGKIISAYMSVSPGTYFDALELYAGAPVNEDFAHLAHPTLTLVGADDSITLTSNALSSQLLMHSSLIVVPDANNTLFIDQPQFTFERIHEFIADPSAVKTDYTSFECHVAKYVMRYFNDAFEQVLNKKALQA
ncbi:Pimeloyl-ACP methyl ester carboxylesterase [Paenibacillus catalpae]|uniref:Pimeloyl-ACP methyl ester carboxylesterase n=1 Tax=Paenibacillus catalpae TaxID=1045775 RepID=A0A1I2BQT8_9BACL|nr:alpha/beta hydrolase [Paenibacillus catalpae]SFE57683.1 Pimeloyl-ACP methyl ester carboxylesterase [Paenibacillus catalpae]